MSNKSEDEGDIKFSCEDLCNFIRDKFSKRCGSEEKNWISMQPSLMNKCKISNAFKKISVRCTLKVFIIINLDSEVRKRVRIEVLCESKLQSTDTESL